MHYRSLLYFIISISLSILILTPSLKAQPDSTRSVSDTLLVGIAGSEPFIIHSENENEPEGIAIEIWENIANNKNWLYRYKSFNSVGDAIAALNSGAIDMVVGPISITSARVKEMGFSQPYFQSSLAIVSRAEAPSLWEKIKPFFSFKLLIAVAVFLFILAIVGTLLWLAERKASPEQFPANPAKGIGNGMWLAIVTMSTTGYGDMAPITLKGRIIAGTWMVVAIIFATSMVAGIASTLTLSSLSSSTVTNIEQLSGKKVATIKGSSSESFLKEHNANEVGVASLQEAFTKLKDRDVYALIYDRPQLKYYLKNNEDKGLYLAKAEYYKQGYGFAFPLNSPLVHDVNRTMLELAEDHSTARIIDFYLGAPK